MAESAGDDRQRQGGAMRRRGLIAGAAALVAGLAAKQASQPVAATSGTGTDGTFVLGSYGPGNSPNYALSPTELVSGFSVPGPVGFHGSDLFRCSASPFQSYGDADVVGISGTSRGSAAGVYGSDTPGQKPTGYPANMNAGVYGYTALQGHSGVRGNSGTSGIGVQGQCDSSGGIGVIGASAAGVGLKGAATTGFPVIGQVVGPASINAGVLGVGTAGPGVQGQSTSGHGLVGTTSGTDGVHAGLIGTVQPGSNAIGVRGSVSAGSVGYAGIFDGDVIINGALRVFGSPKNAAVKHPGDGTYRLLYCEESPESWFADYGRGTLAGGTATVKLDPDFAALVHADDYHVFLTAEGDSKGLYVTDKTPTGFAVREQQHGTSAIGFSYRVVAKRKDIVGERLAKVAPSPPLKAVTPFTVPATSEQKLPINKP